MDRANSSKIKAVILDYGEVLCYPPTAKEWERMAGAFGLERVRFRQLWDINRLRYDRGDLTPEAYWSALAKDAGTRLGPEQLEPLRRWDAEMWAHIDPIMVGWLKGIHTSGMKTGLLSNMPHDMIDYARQKFAWLEDFDHLNFSAEVSLTKPDRAIYEHSLRGVGVAAEEALFVDDKEANIQGAREVGLSALRFRSVQQFADDLDKLGFSILPQASKSSPSV